MAFVVPLIGAALGLGSVGTAVLQLGFAGAAFAASKSLKSKNKSTRERGQNLSLRIDANAPKQAIFGRAPNAGSLVYWQCTGANNQTLHMVIALADHECQGLAELWVDGKAREWNALTGVVDGFNGKLKVRFYNGSSSQTVDTAVRDASGGRWTDNERGIGVCYAVVEATEDETVFKGGIPQIVFVVDGAKLYDRRKDSTVGGAGAQRRNDPSTWEFSANSAVIVDNVLWQVTQNGSYLMGLRAPADTVRMSDFEAAANICDEQVAKKSGGYENRYECGFVVDIGPGLFPEREALDLAIESMAGDVITTGGIYRIFAGAAQPIVATLSDADLVVTKPFMRSQFRPRTELTNAITAEFSNPDMEYRAYPLPIRSSSLDEAADGGARWVRALDLRGVTSRSQGQRVMEIRRREARRQLRSRATLIEKWFTLEAGDWIAFNSGRAGWEGRTFRIGDSSEAEDMTSERAFIEVDTEIDDWDTSMELDDDAVADLPSAGPTLTAVSGFQFFSGLASGIGGAQVPSAFAIWVPITDPTVTAIRIRYRKQGDTEPLGEVYVLDPSTGMHAWRDGIQGGLIYEAQALPVTMPLRGVDWTPWTPMANATEPHKVDVAVLAEDVPDGTITVEKLAEQARRTLELVTASENAHASVYGYYLEMKDEVQRLSETVAELQAANAQAGAFIRRQEIIRQTDTESFAQTLVQMQAAIDANAASIIEERIVRANAIEAEASARMALGTTVGDLSAIVGVVAGTVDGMKAYYGVSVDVNGRFGFFRLDGTGAEVSALFAADKFAVMGTSGNKTPFYIDTVTGEVVITGTLLTNGIVKGEHIEANTLVAEHFVGKEIVAAMVRSADNKMRSDYENKIFEIVS